MRKSGCFEFRFSSAHLYHQPLWSETQNKSEFGHCYSKHGHGHNYRLLVIVAEAENKLEVKNKIQKVVDLLEHKHLNFEVPFFKDKVPTSEVIVQFFAEKLKNLKPLKIALFEDDFLGAESESHPF